MVVKDLQITRFWFSVCTTQRFHTCDYLKNVCESIFKDVSEN